MVAQTYYTIPSSGVYRSPDGRENYWFYEDDLIPMELAVRMGMDGATLPDPDPYFTADEQAAIAQIASENVSGAVPLQTYTDWDRAYDNRTAGAGEESNYTIFPFTLVGGLIRIEEANKQIIKVGFRVITGAVGATARVSVYGNNPGNSSARGMAGTLLHDAGTVSVATSGLKEIDIFAAGLTADPELYWILVEPSDEITIAGFQSQAGHLGQNPATGAVYSGMTHNRGVSMDPHPASIGTASRAQIAPLVLFWIDAAG